MPDDSEDEFALAVNEVDSADICQMNVLSCSYVHRVVGVLDLDDSLFALHRDLFPFYDHLVGWVWLGLTNSLLHLNQLDSVSQIFNQVVDIAVFNVEGVDPHSEDAFVLGTFQVVIVSYFGSCVVIFGGGESWTSVENLSAENQVQFVYS